MPQKEISSEKRVQIGSWIRENGGEDLGLFSKPPSRDDMLFLFTLGGAPLVILQELKRTGDLPLNSVPDGNVPLLLSLDDKYRTLLKCCDRHAVRLQEAGIVDFSNDADESNIVTS